MKAKELLLEYEDIEYPENVISYSQRKAYKKKLLKQKKNGNQRSLSSETVRDIK